MDGGNTVRKTPVRITQDMLITARNLIKTGATLEWAARNVGCSKGGLSNALKRAGMDMSGYLDRTRGHTKYTQARGQLIVKLVKEGATLREAAERAQIRYFTLTQWRKKGLIDVDKHRRHGRRPGDEGYRRMYMRYVAEKDSTPGEIARIYRVNYYTLLANWRRLGFAIDSARQVKQRAESDKRTNAKKRPNGDEIRAAWRAYRDGQANCAETTARLHMGWGRIKDTWRSMGYNVDYVIRQKMRRRGRHGENTGRN